MSGFCYHRYSDSDIKRITMKLDSKKYNENNKHCHLWIGCVDKYGYGRIRVQARSICNDNLVRKVERISRLKYFLSHGGLPLAANYDVSHLCHTKTCYNVDHLRLERHRVNSQRQSCRRRAACSGHGDNHPCIM